MILKTFIVLTLLAVIVTLGSGLVFLIKDKNNSHRTARALTLRITLSLGLFVLLLLAYAAGLITPHGVFPTSP